MPEISSLHTTVANRAAVVRQGAWRGAVGGLCWSVPIATVLAISFLSHPVLPQPDTTFIIFVSTVGTWVGIAASVGAGKARESTMSEEARRVLRNSVQRAALQATIFSSPVVAFFLLTTWGYGPANALIGGSFIMGIWVGSAAFVGHLRGMHEVDRREHMDQTLSLAVHVMLGEKRESVQRALEQRFGILSETARQRLQSWDLNRLTEVSERLLHAGSPRDLGLED